MFSLLCSLITESVTNVITLSESFYAEIDQHKIPAERKVVAALANAPLYLALMEELDLSAWPHCLHSFVWSGRPLCAARFDRLCPASTPPREAVPLAARGEDMVA